MMVATFKHPAEFILLLGLVLALPLFEAPKNLLWGAWIIVWLYHRVRDKDYGGPWNNPDGRVVAQGVSCRPCNLDGCGGSKASDCLATLPVAVVLETVERLLGTQK